MPPRATRMYLDKGEIDRPVIDVSRERVTEIFDRFDHVCVSFSGGKDSTVCLNLVLDEHRRRHGTPPGVPAPPALNGASPEGDDGGAGGAPWDGAKLHVVFYDEEAIPYQTEEYVRRVAELPDVDMFWSCLPVKHINSCSPAHPWWTCWDPDQPEKWCRPLPPEAVTEWPGVPAQPPDARLAPTDVTSLLFDPAKYGTVAFVMGIRAQESMTRLRAVTRRKQDNWIVPDSGLFARGNVFKCYPIYDWTTQDVWTAPARYDWDYNEAYDAQELIGIHGAGQRIAPPFGAEPMQMLHMYAKAFPELWDKMVDRVPGAATAARYSRTELYSFKGRPAPREGETWQDLIRRLLMRHEESIRTEVAKRLQGEIRWHNAKIREIGWDPVDNPILPTAPHPLTGMSWEWCAMIAMRGDIKKRKTAGWELGEDSPEHREKLWSEYRAQLAEVRAAEKTVGLDAA